MKSHGFASDFALASAAFVADAASPVCTVVAEVESELFLSLPPHAPSASAPTHASAATRAIERVNMGAVLPARRQPAISENLAYRSAAGPVHLRSGSTIRSVRAQRAASAIEVSRPAA